MSTPTDGPGSDGDGPHGPDGTDGQRSQDPVGSVGEEAAKLFGALSDWAREQGDGYSGSATGATGAVGRALHDVNEHLATDSADCRYCPVCQVIHVVRGTSPEVRTHLAVAASSLISAAAGLLATRTDDQGSPTGVEKIHLDDDSGWDDQ